MDPSPRPSGKSPLQYFLIHRDQAGQVIEFEGFKGQDLVEILPLAISSDQLVAVGGAQAGQEMTWHMLMIDTTGKVVKQETHADRSSAVKAWSALSGT